jgi:sec-independent protein translocase protein TatA
MFEGLFQPTHILLVLIIAVLIFGPSKLPEIGAGLGKAIGEFKKAISAPPPEKTPDSKEISKDQVR